MINIFLLRSLKMRPFYVAFKKAFLFAVIMLSFVSSSYAMDEFYGELEYNNATNVTTCTCRYNASQFSSSSRSQWSDNWEPNVVTGLATGVGFAVIGDLLNYDYDANTQTGNYKSLMWNFCLKPLGNSCLVPCFGCMKSCGKGTLDCCGSCPKKTSTCCKKCSKCCRKHEKSTVKGTIDPNAGQVSTSG